MTDEHIFEIRDRLTVLEEGHERIMEKLERQDEVASEFQHRISESLIGNGKPGIITRIDRIEQRHLSGMKLYWILAAAVATSMADRAWAWIKTH